MFKKFLIIIIISLFWMNPFALQSNDLVSDFDITVSLSPRNPVLNENIKAVVNSIVIDLDKSYFVWYLNNQMKLRGVGKKSLDFYIDGSLYENLLEVQIQVPEGKVINKIMTIYGGDIDLLWEAVDSYSPPFYKGKTFFPKESQIKVVALPHIYSDIDNKKQSQHTLNYNWSLDGKKSLHNSGFGKSSFIFRNTFLESSNVVEVLITDIENKSRISKFIELYPKNPEVFFYKKDPSGIRLEKTIDDYFYIDKNGENIVAVPYFFNPKNIFSEDLKISWTINGRKITETNKKNELYIVPERNENSLSEVIIGASVINKKTLFQEVEKFIRVVF